MVRHIEQFAQFELSYRVQGQDPGFAGVLSARFEHESGHAMTVKGFYDGDATYRIRFMPTLTGRWTFAVESAMALGGETSGEITAVAGAIPGRLRVDPKHPHHMLFENDQRFYLLGNTAYNLISSYRAHPDEADEFLEFYAARGINWVRFFLSQILTLETGQGVVWPWGGTFEAPDYSTFSLETFRLAERALAKLADLGNVASVILLHPLDKCMIELDKRHSSAEKLAIVHRYFDYVLARLGSYWNVVWNIANEWALGDSFRAGEVDAAARYLDEKDPYQRLTACHNYARFEFGFEPWADISSIQHRGLPHEVNAVARVNRAYFKPVINEEYGYEGDNFGPPSDATNVRRDHWALAMAGAYGAYGEKTRGYKRGGYFASTLKVAINPQGPSFLPHIRTIMEKVPYWEMSPCNEYLRCLVPEQAFCLARPGREYVVYTCVGQEVVLWLVDVLGASVAYEWWNPRTGEMVDSGHKEFVNTDSAKLSYEDRRWGRFMPPDWENDWVLIVRNPERF